MYLSTSSKKEMFKISCYYFRVIHHTGNGNTLHCGYSSRLLCICDVLQLCITYYYGKNTENWYTLHNKHTVNLTNIVQAVCHSDQRLCSKYYHILLFLQYIPQYAYCFLNALNELELELTTYMNLQNIFTQKN